MYRYSAPIYNTHITPETREDHRILFPALADNLLVDIGNRGCDYNNNPLFHLFHRDGHRQKGEKEIQ